MPARTEVLDDRTIGGKETLGVAGCLKPLHTLLPLAGGLVRVLRPIIKIAVPAMYQP